MMGPIWPVFVLPFSKDGRQLLAEMFSLSDGEPMPDPPQFSGHGDAAVSECPFCGQPNGVKHPVYFTYFCTNCGKDVSSVDMNALRRYIASRRCGCDGL